MKKIVFPYYSGKIYDSNCIGLISLEKFVSSQRSPSDYIKETINDIREAGIKGDSKLKNKLKTKLFSFTPSVMIDVGQARRYENIKSFTGLMQIDLDKLPSKEAAIGVKEHIFHTHEEIICCYLSPSGLGVKALMKIKTPDDIEHYKAIHKAVEKEFSRYNDHFDPATKNAILPLFLSVDEDMLVRDYEDAKTWQSENWSRTEYVSLKKRAKTNFNYADKSKDGARVFGIIEKRINTIVSNGHPQVRNTALVLGSRVAAGYVGEIEARTFIENLIHSNAYLQKGIAGYIKTANWGITEGMKQPKYF